MSSLSASGESCTSIVTIRSRCAVLSHAVTYQVRFDLLWSKALEREGTKERESDSAVTTGPFLSPPNPLW